MKPTFCCLALVVGLTLRTTAESNTTNILDGVATDAAGPFTLGDTGPFNFLLITNGGALTNTIGTVGAALEAQSNLAIVSGTNSVWYNSSNFILGATGSMNQVSIRDGARMNVDRQALLGLDRFSANNLLLVSGPGTFLDMPWFHLGQAGSNNQIIATDGARVGRGISNDLVNNIGDEEGSGGNLLLVSGPGTTWYTDGFRVGNRGWRNRAVVRDGARLTNGFLTVGCEISAMANVVQVQGIGSVWKVQNPSVFIGFNGSSNQLQISDGARFETPQTTVGLSNAAAVNVAELRDPGTVWANTGSLTVGDAGPLNFLTVANGALLRSGSISIGNNSANNRAFIADASVFNTADLWIGTSSNAFNNLLSLEGPGAIWTNMSRVTLGRDGSGNRLVLTDGAVLRLGITAGAIGFMIGSSAASRSNELVIADPNSALQGPWALTVGSAGSGNHMLMANGARVQSSSTDIGQSCIARDNLAFVTGAGTVWSNGQLQVGFCSTNNHLVVSNGAQVFAGLVRSSVQGGASNTITVTGPGSLLRAAGDFILGNSGTANSLFIADGGRLEGRNDRIGWGGGNNAATLLHPGTSWSNTSLTIGDTTPGNHLTVANGARIDSGGAMLGAGAKSSGNMATLSGASSAWNVVTNLMLGGLGHSNRLVIVRGAAAAARNVYLGAGSMVNPTALFNSDWNSVWIEGSNSVLSASSNVVVGAYGRFNDLEIRDGAQVHDSDGVVGLASGSRSNLVLVSGPGALWLHTNSLIVGSNGLYNEMTVSAGARVINAGGYLGITGVDLYGGSGCFGALESFSHVSVTGQQSVWENRGNLFVGYGAGGNQLTVTAGGTVLANGLTIGRVPGIRNSGSCPPVTNVVVIDGGCLFVTNAAQDALLDPSYGTLIVNGGWVVADRIQLTNGNLSRIELRGGDLQILRGRTYTGLPLVVGDGLHGATLQLGRSGERPYLGRLDLGHGVVLRPHARLMGHGIVVGDITNAGIISAGAPLFGQLSVDGNVHLQPESILLVDIGGVEESEYDSLNCDFQGIETSTLRVSLHNGFVPAPTDVFNIITSFRSANGFTNVALGGRVKTADQLGSFLLSNSYPSFVLTDYQSTDLDGDGIEDAWATDHFGHTPLTAPEKLADADGDGVSNYDEFRAGTDPNDPASALKLSIGYAGSAATVSFPCVDGKEYRVWSSNDLETWGEVRDPSFAYPAAGRCEWTEDGKDTGGLGAVTRFYRVTVE